MARRSARKQTGPATLLGVQAGTWLAPAEVPVVIAALVEREIALHERAREAELGACEDASLDAPDAWLGWQLRQAANDVGRLLNRLGALRLGSLDS